MPFRIPAHPGYRRCKEVLRLTVPEEPIEAWFTFRELFLNIGAHKTVQNCTDCLHPLLHFAHLGSGVVKTVRTKHGLLQRNPVEAYYLRHIGKEADRRWNKAKRSAFLIRSPWNIARMRRNISSLIQTLKSRCVNNQFDFSQTRLA